MLILLLAGAAVLSQSADPDLTIPCNRIPGAAVRVVPAPLDQYVTLVCTRAGQALKPLNGDTWVFDQGATWLGAANPKGPSETDYYTQLSYRPLTSDEATALRSELAKLHPDPSVLTRTILRFSVRTSWGGQKEIYLLPPPPGAGGEAHTLGMECIHACRPIDKDPWFFTIIARK